MPPSLPLMEFCTPGTIDYLLLVQVALCLASLPIISLKSVLSVRQQPISARSSCRAEIGFSPSACLCTYGALLDAYKPEVLPKFCCLVNVYRVSSPAASRNFPATANGLFQ